MIVRNPAGWPPAPTGKSAYRDQTELPTNFLGATLDPCSEKGQLVSRVWVGGYLNVIVPFIPAS